MQLLSILELFLRNFRTVLAVLLIVPAVAFAIGTALLHTSAIYAGSSKVSILPTNTELAFASEFVRSSPQLPANLISLTHIEYLKSRPIAKKTIDRLMEARGMTPGVDGFEPPAPNVFSMIRRGIRTAYNVINSGYHVTVDPYTDAILSLQDSITVDLVEGTYILRITVYWDDPDVAAEIANILSQVYVEELLQQATASARELEAFIKTQIDATTTGPAERSALQDQIVAVRLAMSNARGNLRLIEPAVPSNYPAFPKVAVITIIGGAIAVAAALFVLVGIDTFSNRLRTHVHMKAAFGEGAIGPMYWPGWMRALRLAPSQAQTVTALEMWRASDGEDIDVISAGNDSDAVAAANHLIQLYERHGRKARVNRVPKITAIGGLSGSLRLGSMERSPRRVVMGVEPGVWRIDDIRALAERASAAVGRDVLGVFVPRSSSQGPVQYVPPMKLKNGTPPDIASVDDDPHPPEKIPIGGGRGPKRHAG